MEVAAVKKRATQAEKDHMGRVAALNCIICMRPAQVHHLPQQGGKRNHFMTIPLCPRHHQHGGFGTAVHQGRRTWEARYGTEMELWHKTNKLLDMV